MQRDKKNIDAAQMQGQIAGAVIATSQKAGHLEGLVRQQKCGKQPAYVPAPGRRAFSVQKNAHGCKQGGARQPRKMQGAKWEKPSPSGMVSIVSKKYFTGFLSARPFAPGRVFQLYYTAVSRSLQAGYSASAAQTGFARHTRPLPAGRAVRLCSTLPQTGCFFPCAALCCEQAVLSRAPGRRARD